MSETLRAPFPYFGGKSRVAPLVWRAFGDVPNFVEPFFGSGAVLLGRPHAPRIETVNDKDCFVANFWRSVTLSPDETARWCDWPVNEADLHARHLWLAAHRAELRERLLTDPDAHDAKIAGWWAWGLSQWIGGGWCAEDVGNRKRPVVSADSADSAGKGVHRKMPDCYSRSPDGKGINLARRRQSRQPPALGNGGSGLFSPKRQPPDLQGRGRGRGRGLHSSGRLPSLGNMRGVHGETKAPCSEWFADLQARLRRVRIVCGDWKRVLGDSVLGTTKSRNSGMNPCAVFLDPPYSNEGRDPDLYAEDSGTVSADVATWCRERGDDPDLRIALCGYEGEHDMPRTWRCVAWKALRGYGGADNENRKRERIWLSPHCLDSEQQTTLFPEAS